MSRVLELFGESTSAQGVDWLTVVGEQQCPYLSRTCIKVRKSQPEISIGTCSVIHGKANRHMIICPFRLLERKQIFMDCLHLLSLHELGNQLHIVSEVSVPGGSVDYFLVSVREERVVDFVGIELQTMDTTGTVWPARQRFLQGVGVEEQREIYATDRRYGMNWKMTAKTTLIQLHHKIQTFESINKHLALITQSELMEYLRENFEFDHVHNARRGDSMHFHAYEFRQSGETHAIQLLSRASTNAEGMATCLGLKAEPTIDFQRIVEQIEKKLSDHTLFTI